MRLIHSPLVQVPDGLQLVRLAVDRLRLAKRRWRGIAADGEEFGFDLEQPLRDGAFFFVSATAAYQIHQLPEPVIEVPCPIDPVAAARLGWMLGNLHFPIEPRVGHLRITDDPAIRQMLLRENIGHTCMEAVFQPLAGAHSHGA